MGYVRVLREYNCTLAKSCRRRRLRAAHHTSCGGGGVPEERCGPPAGTV